MKLIGNSTSDPSKYKSGTVLVKCDKEAAIV